MSSVQAAYFRTVSKLANGLSSSRTSAPIYDQVVVM